MVNRQVPVNLYVSRGVDPLKFQIHPLLLRIKLRLAEVLFVSTGTTPVVVSAVLAVFPIPGVGNVHLLYAPIRPVKGPFPVQADICSRHFSSPLS